MFFVFAALFPVSSVLASQHVFQDGIGLPNPNLWNRTCNEEPDLVLSHSYPVCPKPANVTTKPGPVVKPGPSPYGPWSEVSECIQNPAGPDFYCVFTSTTFANNRGISVFTTPAVAEHMATRAAFVSPEVPADPGSVPTPSYVVQPLAGRGLGAIVNNTLFRGERVMSISPVLVIHRKAQEDVPDEDRIPFQKMAVERLPLRTRELVFSMHAQFGLDPVEDILNTNAFQVDLGADDEPHAVLFPETARMNHDCRPNVQYVFDPNTMKHNSHALRTIHVGEELTVTYTDISVSRAERQIAIKASWGFACSCSLCRQPEIFTRESDRRLKLIKDLEKHLTDFSNETLASPEMAETLVSLYEQERMDGLIARAYLLAAVAYSSVGQEQPALKYAALAVERDMLISGPYSKDMQLVRDLMQDPKSHATWKSRLPKTT